MKLKQITEKIFSLKNDDLNKVVVILGLKFKFRRRSIKNHIYVRNFYKDMQKLDLKSSYEKLIKNLDEPSIGTVNQIISQIQKNNKAKVKLLDVFSQDEINRKIEILKEFKRNIFQVNQDCWAYRKYFLPINNFESCVFLDKHSLETLNKEYFKNKDIIDAGGFIGDSAIILSDYTNKNVYSFEPTAQNFTLMQKTIKLNNKNNIIGINKALGGGNTSDKLEIYIQGSASGILNFNKKATRKKEICDVITLDDYVKENNLNVGLIKTDLEGMEKFFLEGAQNTIKTQRPTLLISIYHTAGDFFEIKPMIESWNLNYKFKVIKPTDHYILLETLLICEPKEIALQ